MPRSDYTHKLVNNQQVVLTESEIDSFVASEVIWDAGAVTRTAQAEIIRLEGQITPRRIRDSVTTDDGKQWMIDQEALIAEQRELL